MDDGDGWREGSGKSVLAARHDVDDDEFFFVSLAMFRISCSVYLEMGGK